MDDDSSAKSIDDLPVEVMQEIFSYLDHNSMKTATLVSKNWNEIISSSTDFLRRTNFSLRIDANNIRFDLSRKYQNVDISDRRYQNERDQDMFAIFQKVADYFGANLKSLHLECFVDSYRFDNGILLLDLLRHFSNIEELNIDIRWLRGDQILPTFGNTATKVKLSKLKHLTLTDSNWMLSFFECTKLQSFSITHDERNRRDQSHIVQFINEQTHLNSLKLYGVNLYSREELSPKFTCKNLSMSKICRISAASLRNWKKLIESAAAPDAKVILEEVDNPTLFSQIMALFSKNNNIKHLIWTSKKWPELDGASVSRNQNALYYAKMNQILSLEICFISNNHPDNYNSRNIELFLTCFQNLHMFGLRLTQRRFSKGESVRKIDVMDLITKISVIPSLRHLKIDLEFLRVVYGENFPILPALETLELHACISDDFYKNYAHVKFFVDRHSTLRRLMINFSDKLQSVDNFMRDLAIEFPSVEIFEVRIRYRSGFVKHVKTRE